MIEQRTLALIKPDAWPQHGGAIITMITEAGLTIDAIEVCPKLEPGEGTHSDAPFSEERLWEMFYTEHEGKPFFRSLVSFMASGPVLVLVLVGEDAIKRWRALIGPSDSRKAPPESVRGRFGANASVRQDHTVYPMWLNAVHGSDSVEAAAREIAFFFA